ncbi:MAG: histidine phosphatase family protein [Anaerolineae bacterium]|jgi:broad specificity phosphatase PhoE
MLELVLARHGQSHGNLDRSLGPDTDLTDLGRQQARRLRDWLIDHGYRFTAMYASPLRRARQTAEIVNACYGLEIGLDPDLREAEVPYLDVMPQRGIPLGSDSPPPFEGAYEQMRERVTRATARILTEIQEGEVLVVAHSGTLGTMLRTILGTHALLVRTELASIHCLRWQDGRWNLQYVNRCEHLSPYASASTRAPYTL